MKITLKKLKTEFSKHSWFTRNATYYCARCKLCIKDGAPDAEKKLLEKTDCKKT